MMASMVGALTLNLEIPEIKNPNLFATLLPDTSLDDPIEALNIVPYEKGY